MKKATRAFTLVELAIVITIIGLLIGGVLKGQQMLENSRITAVTQQISSYHTAITTFKDIYKALPGDMPNPTSFLGNCTVTPCSTAGDNNQKIDTLPEFVNFWLHLSKANLIKGVNEAETDWTVIPPDTALGGKIHMHYNVYHHYAKVTDCCGNDDNALSPHQAWQIDLKIDDGKPMTGDINGSGASNCTNAANSYVINTSAKSCGIMTPLKS